MCGIKKNNTNTFLINDKKISKNHFQKIFLLQDIKMFIPEMKEFVDCLINNNKPKIEDAVN